MLRTRRRRMNRSRGLSWLVAASLLVVAACGEETTGPAAASPDLVQAFGKPSGEKPGKPSSDISLTVVFTDASYRIQSDLEAEPPSLHASDTYVHGEDFVSAQLKSSGQFYFQAFDGKKKDEADPRRRWVTVDLSSMVEEFSHSDLEAFQAAVAPDWPKFTSDVTLHTRDYDGRIYALAEGQAVVDGGKIAFNDYGDGDAWEWRLLFDTRVDGVADGIGLCVEWDGVNSWTVTAEDGACGGLVDGITELWRVQGGVFIHVADFNTPMRLTLIGN
jgi:hypothetical protein